MKKLKIIIAVTLLNFIFVTLLAYVANSKNTGLLQGNQVKNNVQTNFDQTGKNSNAEISPTGQIEAPTSKPDFFNPSPTQAIVNIQPQPVVTPDNRCIIIVDSQKYDVTEFRNIHGGGNIFTCGTDMTAEFYAHHDASMLRGMQQYKI